ncbi:hypothetical protein EV702DRAFT_1177263 [Suillus placidus]|uniref:C2H2-type domain-containing protein n=1 Tax=Suillus placidus TaxID=48579 RepID=A0A9P7A2Y3_9AGAM|nr:hypothetical protein EV702DRAFT_1177263 [Suillus placidus]
MSYRCPASGCTRSFSTPKGLNAHLRNTTSCKWYKAGKRCELDREEDRSMNRDSMEDLSNAMVDEVDEELFQLIPLNPQYEPLEQPGVPGPSKHAHSLQAEDNDTVTEWYPHAGKVIRIDRNVYVKWHQQFGLTEDEDDMEKNGMGMDEEDSHLFYLFASHLDWEVACWAVQEGIGHKAFDRLLAIPEVRECLGLQYHNIRSLHQTSTHLAFNDKPQHKHELHHRNPLDTIKSLLGNPAHARDIVYKSSTIFTNSTHLVRIYNEM